MNDAPLVQPLAVPRPVPLVLSFVAGYVDSCTYLALFGTFVAQVTGSFVLAGTLFFQPESGAVAKTLAIPFFFLAGFAVTLLVNALSRRPRAALAWSLAAECLLLIGFLWVGAAAAPFRDADGLAAVIALLFGVTAMGAQSALVRLLMRGKPSTNVMTTNTTQLAIDVADALLGLIERRRGGAGAVADKRYLEARDGIAAFLPMALGFLAGTATGAAAYGMLGLRCVAVAVALVAGLVAWSARPSPAPA